MSLYRLRVRSVDYKCLSSDGEWDKTYDTFYEWVIEDVDGIEVAGMDGYPTYDKARKAGVKKLKDLEEE